MVSKARLDLPEPERPVTTISLSLGISTEMSLRLWTRAPCTAMVVRAAARPFLEFIRFILREHKRQLLRLDITHLRELNWRGDLRDQPAIRQVFACHGDAFH